MAAIQCDNFVGNVWKKDLCLNCLKSKEEHVLKNGHSVPIPTRIPDPPKEGILKGTKSSNQTPKGNKVIFLNTEYEVIGFGGDDVYSDDEDFPDKPNSTQEDEDEVDSEEDKAFQKLTKTNTDFNSIAENLQEPKEGEVKKVVEPLKLGKQVFDDKGNKKTLLVSVTPFGDQSSVKKKLNLNSFKVNFLVDSDVKTNGNVNDVKIEKTKSEKTENGVNGVKEDLINGKSEEVTNESQNEIAQIGKEDGSGKLKKGIKRSPPLEKFIKELQVKNGKNGEVNGKEETLAENDKLKTSDKVDLLNNNNNLIDKSKKKVSQFPVITDSKDLGKPTDNNKAVVLDMYKIRENGDVKILNKLNESPSIRSKFLSSEMNGVNKKIEKTPSEVLQAEKKVESVPEKAQNGSTIDRSKLVPNVSSLYRHHFKNVPATKDTEEVKPETPKPLVSNVVSSTTLVPNLECSYTENEKTCPEVTEEQPVDEKFKKTSFESFEKFENIIKGEEITLFSAGNGVKGEEKKEENEKDDIVPEISRESAGEPDGMDSDDLSDLPHEPPALPLKPAPPLTDPRSNFLHDFIAGGDGVKVLPEKPRVPAKPIIIHSKKTNFQSPSHSTRPRSPSMEKFLDLSSTPQAKSHPPLQETLSSDSSKNQKRPAPKPPSPKEDSSERYVALPVEVETEELEPKASVVEEPIVKRISRSTENLLEFITDQEDKDHLCTEGLEEISVPEPVPRRSLSLSQDSLVPGEVGDIQSKKKPSRGRFFLRKLLHLGKPKDGTKDLTVRPKSLLPPAPKSKIEIIHPSDLSGSRVEVVPPARTSKSRRTSSSASSSSGEQRESDVLSDSSTSHSVSSSGNDSQSTIDKAKKPPPPPRTHLLDTWSTKPARPPPPKSIEILRQANSTWTTSVETKLDNLYVNLGEARSGLAPNKPVRTGSTRETRMDAPKRLLTVVNPPEDSDYESFVVTQEPQSTLPNQSEDNLYECVQMSGHRSSLPECHSNMTESPNSTFVKEKRSANSRNAIHRRSEGNVELNADYFRMKFMRSVSFPYCSSEADSEIYSPHSFYGSELGEDDYELSSTAGHTLRMSRLKLKKGRSIVHKNLEDNYGAVIVANHEALTQVVEQMRQGPTPPLVLRALSTTGNLRWTDFTIAKDAVGVVVDKRVFYPALWGTHSVTLSLMAEQGLNSSFHTKGPFSLNPLTELNDLVPSSYLPMLKKDESELVQASIAVLTRLQIESVESYGKSMNAGVLNDETKKEVNFVLLQIINALKTLQAQGIEEAPENLTNLVVCREEKDPHPRICITHSFERSEDGSSKCSLCQCVTHAIKDIIPPTDLTPLLSNILRKEKAVSLSQAKGILEFTLWGPADIAFGHSSRERESALQRWLDLERATVLHGLVRTRAELTVFEECQLLFLVRTNAKMMAEASLLLESGVGECSSA